MGQVLKTETRDKIIALAKASLLEHGVLNCSMRQLAQQCGMTVGNLYRYFKSKDDIVSTIVQHACTALETMISEVARMEVRFDRPLPSVSFSAPQFSAIVQQLPKQLISLYRANQEEIDILMMPSAANQALLDWVSDNLARLIQEKVQIKAVQPLIRSYSASLASSVFHGVKSILQDKSVKNDQQRILLLKLYFANYQSLLQAKTADLLGVLL